jgi:hypothetical protein
MQGLIRAYVLRRLRLVSSGITNPSDYHRRRVKLRLMSQRGNATLPKPMIDGGV